MSRKIEHIFKPCPFCKNQVTIHITFDEENEFRFGECENCGATGPIISSSINENQHETWVKAQEAWNKRL